MKAISEDLQPLLSVAAAVLDSAGVLLEANAGFMRMVGTGPRQQVGADATPCFSLPRFAELATAQPMSNGEVYRGAMRFRDGAGESVELRGRVWRSAYGLCVLAEVDVLADGIVQRASETDERRETRREVRTFDPAQTDKLTGTGNLDRLDQALAAEISQVRRTGLPLSVLVAGPDGFEKFNAIHGQGKLDKVLARFGFLLRLLTRPADITTRCATAGFAVVLPHTNLAQAVTTADRIRKAFETDPVEVPGDRLTASIGIAEFQAEDDAATFLARATAAFHSARNSSSNRVLTAA